MLAFSRGLADFNNLVLVNRRYNAYGEVEGKICDFVGGYAYAEKIVSVEKLEEYLRKNNRGNRLEFV